MALTNNNLEMIKAIAKNDIHTARKAAIASLTEDKSKKNASIIDYYRKLITGSASVVMSSLPSEMKTILVGEVPAGFNVDRYYIRESEKGVISDIASMKIVSEEMELRGIPYRNTTLLYGESGTGKTELGRYIANKLNLPFFYISFVSTIDSFLGSTAKNIHKVFNFCNSIPCVLMIDELDCVATKRSNGGGKGVDGEIERTTVALMQELDSIPNHVTLIAATNRLDMIDEALLRRFSVRHEVKNMSSEELYDMMLQYVKATYTNEYVTETFINHLATKYENPGQVMPELIKEIGKGIYEEKKDELLKKEAEEDNDKIDLWEVSYTWRDTICAETEEDAIAIARKEQRYGSKHSTEEYKAKRAEFISVAESEESR